MPRTLTKDIKSQSGAEKALHDCAACRDLLVATIAKMVLQRRSTEASVARRAVGGVEPHA